MTSVQGIIDRQLRRWEIERAARAAQPPREKVGPPEHPLITVSRQRGSGGSRIAELVARRFDYTLLHRDVIDRICASGNIRRSIVESLDEHAKSQIAIWCDAMVAQRYTDSSDYVRLLLETIRSVAALGGVVVVGRGANFIAGPEHGLHVRVVAPRETRIQRLVDHARLSRKDAAREVETSERERAEFIRKVYGRDIGDPEGYDLVVNTGAITFDEAVDLVAGAAKSKFERLRRAIEGAGTPGR
jgi:cytidylate kinase